MPSDYEAAVLALAPSAFWPMDEASGLTLADLSGGAHTLTMPGAGGVEAYHRQVPPGFGTDGALDWQGVANSCAACASSTELGFGSGVSFTLEVWVATASNPAANTGFVTKGIGPAGQNTPPWYLLRWLPTGQVDFFLRTGTPADFVATSYGNISDYSYLAQGPWHLIHGVYDNAAGTAAIWIDGLRHAAVAAPAAAYGTNASAFNLNRHGGNCGGELMGMAAVYSFALTPAQMQAHYDAGRGGATWYGYQVGQDNQSVSDKLDRIYAAVHRTW